MRFVASMSCLLLIAVAGSPALAQRRGHSGGFRGGQGHSGSTRPTPFVGVPSEAPRPVTSSSSPPGQSQYRPMPVAPWPGVNVTPGTSGSGRPMHGGGQGNPGFDGRGSFGNGGSGNRGNRFTGSGFSGSGFDGTNATISSGSGLTVNGYYSGDNFRLGVHLGSTAFNNPYCRPRCNYPVGWNCGNYPTWWAGYPTWWGDTYYAYDDGYRYGTIYGFYSEPDPAMNPAPAPGPTTQAITPSTNRELGDTYLHAGDPRGAIRAYQAHLRQYPGDEEAMRSLGLALIDGGQTTEGVAMIAMAYKAEPMLCDRPVSPDVYRHGAEGLARNLSRVSIYANRVKTASGWLSIAVLMQAQGRDDLAKSMVERARSAGLESAVADRMLSALR